MNTKVIFGVLLIFVQFICIFGQTPRVFSAQFRISRDPNVVGILNGRTYYNADAKKLRNDYAVGAVEVFNFTGSGIRYLGCEQNSVCDAETWRDDMPVYYKENSDVSGTEITGIDQRQCYGWNKVNPKARAVKSIWIDSNGKICRAEFVHPSNPALPGRRIEFLDVQPIGNVNLDIYLSWPCPSQTCAKLMDIILVFDESGSISAESFTKEKQFATNFARAFKFGATGVSMELIMFSGTARRIMPLSTDQTNVINYINGVQQKKGSTCIGCGVQLATSDFRQYGRPGVSKVLVVLTDGENNVEEDTFSQVLRDAKQSGMTIFSIGVDSYDRGELIEIASNITGIQTVFESEDFNNLQNILNSFIISTCIDIPGNPCGTGCLGFCACRSTCLCPDMCNDTNACTNDVCVNNTNGNGCIYQPKSCNDNNACTTDGCSPTSGCVNTPINCNDGNECTNEVCNPNVGCQRSTKNCNDNNPCTSETCSTTLGCQYQNVTCDKCSFPVNVTCTQVPCKIVECDPAVGECKTTNVICNDNNACTNDICNVTTNACQFNSVNCDDGNACTFDSCDPSTGCKNIPFNASECDDYNVCTTDFCDTTLGCVNKPVVCTDNSTCTIDQCNSLTGCYYNLRDCSSELPTSTCTAALCNDVTGCYLQGITNLVQKCGKCVDDGPCDNIVAIATISGGVVAGIIIAGVAVFAAIGTISGRAGYLAYMKNKNNMSNAQSSPLYQDNGLSGTSPFYENPSSGTNA